MTFDGKDSILDPVVQSLTAQILRFIPRSHGSCNVDGRLDFLADFHGVDDGLAGCVDDINGVAVFVYYVHSGIVGTAPDTAGFDTAHPDSRDEYGD